MLANKIGGFVSASLVSAGLCAQIRISEIAYHPTDETLEFVELTNSGPSELEVGGWAFTDGIGFELPAGTSIAAGERIVLARDRSALLAVLAIAAVDASRVFGNFDGALSNGGERLTLRLPDGTIADEVKYSDSPPWDPAADGTGPALERLCLTADAALPGNWRASLTNGGTPLAPNSQAACPPPPPLAFSGVVINEIYYHPPDGGDPVQEFIELANRTPASQDLHGWQLTGAVEHTFDRTTGPATLPPQGFLLVALDPAAVASLSGIAASAIAGPYVGKLSNFKDEVRLVDPAGVVLDQVMYEQDGLWPARADGLGSSLQRVSTEISGALARNWRVSDAATCAGVADCELVENGSSVRWFESTRGLDPGFSGGRPWFHPDFDDVANRWSNGRLAVGYDTRDPTAQPWVLTPSSALNGLHSILLRLEFVYDPTVLDCGSGIPYLAMDWDDGFVAWLNGVEIARGGMLDPAGTVPAFDGAYRADVVTAGGFRQAEPTYQPVWVGTPTALRAGRNVLAIGNYNSRDTSSDLYLTAKLTLGSPSRVGDFTAGAPNTVASAALPAGVLEASHAPAEPRSSDTVTITARVEGAEGGIVELIIDTGAGEERLAMLDDGLAGDTAALDGVYSAKISPQADGTLLKYRLEARSADAAACVGLFPREGNPSRWTGYLVENDRPALSDETRLIYCFTPGALGDLSCADGVYQSGTFVDFRGRAYFGAGFKHRGATACSYPKKPLRVRFQKGDLFDGQEHLNFNACWNDKSMLREKLCFDFFRDAGVAYSETYLARIHSNGGAFHGAYFAVEDPSVEYLRRNEWDADGPLYKCFTAMLDGGTSAYEAQNDAGLERLAEVGAFGSQLNAASGQALIDLLNSRADIEALVDYQAVQAITIDMDSVTKNWLLYLGPHGRGKSGNERFAIFPWDLDLTCGQMRLTTDVREHTIHPLMHTQTYPFTDQGHHGIINALLERAPGDYYIKAHYGRLWHLLQDKFHPKVLLPRIDAYDDATIAQAVDDLAKWPRTWGARGTDPAYWRADLKSWVERRFNFLTAYLTADNPTTLGRRFRYTPAPQLKITEIHYNPAGESEAGEFIELANLEANDVDVSNWDLPVLGFTFPLRTSVAASELVIVAKDPQAFRAAHPTLPPGLQVFGPYPGNLENGGEELRLRDVGRYQGRDYFPETIDLVLYDDDAPWPLEADGDGKTLELRDFDFDNDVAASWQASQYPGGSPGELELSNRPPVVILGLSSRAGPVPHRVVFDASGSFDPDGALELSVSWDLGDGVIAAGPQVTHTYRALGRFHGVVTVSDGALSAAELFTIEVFAPGGRFHRGDANADGRLDLSDGVFILNFLFLGGARPSCAEAANSNDDASVDLTDAVYLFNHLFTGGAPPAPPGAPPAPCGPDPGASASNLGCEAYPPCGG